MRGTRAVCAGVAIGLVLAGCGGGSSTTGGSPEPTTPEVTASTSTPAETIHSAQPGEPTLIAVPGYSYEDDPSMAETLKRLEESKGYKGFSVHDVTRNGEPVGALVLLEATPAYDRAVESGNLDPTRPPPGTDASRLTIAGVHVTVFERYGGPKSTLWIWYHAGTLGQFFPTGQAMDFVESYLEEANNK